MIFSGMVIPGLIVLTSALTVSSGLAAKAQESNNLAACEDFVYYRESMENVKQAITATIIKTVFAASFNTTEPKITNKSTPLFPTLTSNPSSSYASYFPYSKYEKFSNTTTFPSSLQIIFTNETIIVKEPKRMTFSVPETSHFTSKTNDFNSLPTPKKTLDATLTFTSATLPLVTDASTGISSDINRDQVPASNILSSIYSVTDPIYTSTPEKKITHETSDLRLYTPSFGNKKPVDRLTSESSSAAIEMTTPVWEKVSSSTAHLVPAHRTQASKSQQQETSSRVKASEPKSKNFPKQIEGNELSPQKASPTTSLDVPDFPDNNRVVPPPLNSSNYSTSPLNKTFDSPLLPPKSKNGTEKKDENLAGEVIIDLEDTTNALIDNHGSDYTNMGLKLNFSVLQIIALFWPVITAFM